MFDSITTAINSNADGLFFIDGSDDTDKTFLENLLLTYVRSQGQVALTVVSSEIVSILFDESRISHSRFKISLDIHSESICNISTQSELANLMRITKLIV